MKKVLIHCFCLLLTIAANSQEKIVYSIATDQYILKGKPIDKKTILEKNTDYRVFIKDYNPFYYKIKFETKTKDDLKTFFEFIVKTTKIDATKLPEIARDSTKPNNPFLNNDLIENFIKNYNNSYIVAHSLKSRLFNYETVTEKYNNINDKNLLENYLNIIQIVNSSLKKNDKIDDKLKELGLPIQADVEKLDLLLVELNDVLETYKQNEKTFPVGSFSTNLNTSVATTITLTPIDKDKEALKSEKNISIKNGLNVSFSSGIITAWNAKKQYYTKKLSSGTFIVDTETERKIMPAIAALGNLTLNTKPEIGLCVGASIDIELTPNVLFGITFVPKNSNIFISSGIGLSYQKKISDKYILNTEYAEEPDISKQKDIYQSGFWLGISYKIF